MLKYFESKGPPGGLGALQTLYNLLIGRTGTAQHIYLFNKYIYLTSYWSLVCNCNDYMAKNNVN